MSSRQVTEPAFAAADAAPGGRRSQRRAAAALAKYGTIFGLVVMVIVFSTLAPDTFPRYDNFINILNQASLTAIIAAGLTVVLIVGEFDLSIGYVASFAGVLVTGLLVSNGFPIPLAILAVVAIGGAFGLANGWLVSKLRVNAVIATIGSGTILVGINYAYTNGNPVTTGVPQGFLDVGSGRLAGIPYNVLFMAVVLGLLWVVLNRTDVGQRIQAVGGNPEAARLSGIRVDRVKMLAFALCSACAALTGLLLAAAIGSGQTSAGDSYLLSSFAAVFLGSATLRDGEFHIVGTFVGVLVIGVGLNGLALVGAPTFYQYILQGGFLVGAVALSSVARRYTRR